MLLTRAIYSRNLDLALDLIGHYPSLTLALDDRGESPLLALASMRHAFQSGKRLVRWKKWIYPCFNIDANQEGNMDVDIDAEANPEGDDNLNP
ncbi:hypothetical protein I3843_14G082500 [Carya illinoinensis]|nr:hypothetical protein I3843_14G082500 [Carya illinoinensis]